MASAGCEGADGRIGFTFGSRAFPAFPSSCKRVIQYLDQVAANLRLEARILTEEALETREDVSEQLAEIARDLERIRAAQERGVLDPGVGSAPGFIAVQVD